MLRERITARPRIGDRDSAAALFAPTFTGLAHEALRVAYLDDGLALLLLWEGEGTTPASVDVPLRTLIRDALILGARALIIAHNHPLGDPTPSRADRAVTRRLVEIAHPLDIRVLDHLIFAGKKVASFRGLGLL
jgi:DNA repair protein RadC